MQALLGIVLRVFRKNFPSFFWHGHRYQQYILRKKLRKVGIHKGFDVVFSEELPDKDAIVPMEERNKKSQVGTISYLPAVFGCVCAQAAIQHLIKSV